MRCACWEQRVELLDANAREVLDWGSVVVVTNLVHVQWPACHCLAALELQATCMAHRALDRLTQHMTHAAPCVFVPSTGCVSTMYGAHHLCLHVPHRLGPPLLLKLCQNVLAGVELVEQRLQDGHGFGRNLRLHTIQRLRNRVHVPAQPHASHSCCSCMLQLRNLFLLMPAVIAGPSASRHRISQPCTAGTHCRLRFCPRRCADNAETSNCVLLNSMLWMVYGCHCASTLASSHILTPDKPVLSDYVPCGPSAGTVKLVSEGSECDHRIHNRTAETCLGSRYDYTPESIHSDSCRSCSPLHRNVMF